MESGKSTSGRRHQSQMTADLYHEKQAELVVDECGTVTVVTPARKKKLWTFPVARLIYRNMFPDQSVMIVNESDSEFIACVSGDPDAMVIKNISGKLTISGGQLSVENEKRNSLIQSKVVPSKSSKTFIIIGRIAYYSIFKRKPDGGYSVIRENVLIRRGEVWEAYADGSNSTELKCIDQL